MQTLEFDTVRELKQFASKNRKDITNINGLEFGENYPMLEISNNYASYYDVDEQSYLPLYAPFKVTIK